MGPTWVLWAPDGPHVGPMNLAIRDLSTIGNSMVKIKWCYKSLISTTGFFTLRRHHPYNEIVTLLLSHKHDDIIKKETFSPLLALRAGNSLVTNEFPSQRPVTQSFDIFFDLCLNKRLGKQWWGWWFEMPLCPLWRHCNVLTKCVLSFQNISHDKQMAPFCLIYIL